MNILIKEFDENDLVEVLKVEAKVFGEKGYGTEVFIELIKENKYFYVARDNREIVGYVLSGKLSERKAKLISIAVLPSYQNKGIGSKLLKKVVEASKEDDLDFIELEVRENNEKGISFYRKKGFKKIAIKENYYNNKENAYLMVKNI